LAQSALWETRQTLELLRANGVEPVVREYLKKPPSPRGRHLAARWWAGDHRALIRDGEPNQGTDDEKRPISRRKT